MIFQVNAGPVEIRRVVGTAHKRTARYKFESFVPRDHSVVIEHLGSDVGHNR
jgi:hypothetical protein